MNQRQKIPYTVSHSYTIPGNDLSACKYSFLNLAKATSTESDSKSVLTKSMRPKILQKQMMTSQNSAISSRPTQCFDFDSRTWNVPSLADNELFQLGVIEIHSLQRLNVLGHLVNLGIAQQHVTVINYDTKPCYPPMLSVTTILVSSSFS